jgi:MFS family permease
VRRLKKPSWLNRNVAGMTIASLLSDACHEMVLAVLPGFLPIIGVAAAALGWIEGASDAFSSFLKLAAGWYSDRIGQRKWMVVLGYFFTGTGLSLFTIAKSWPVILLGRMVSWFGKGLRVSLRDAMLSESVPPDDRGKAFGFHRAGDTVGAILGPLAGVALLGWLPHHPPDAPFRTIFLLSLIPGTASSVAFAVLVHETRRRAKQELKLWGALRGLSARYFRFLTGVGLFGMGDFSPSLLIMAASLLLAPRYGPVRAAQLAALFYVVRNIVYAAGAFPMGALGDRLNKRRLLAAGYVTAALAAFGMAGLFMEGFRSLLGCGLIFTLSGLFAAAQDTLEGAIPPDLTPAETRGTAYGMLGAVNGVGDLIASAMVGTVWTLVSPSAAFFTAGTLMLAGAIVMAIAPRR